MRITDIRALAGPNVYMYRPALIATLELDDLTEKESTNFPGFTDRLLTVLPGLRDHHCAKGEPGGFVEQLHGGTYFGHTVEHVAIELTNRAGPGGNFSRPVYAGVPGRYDILMEYRTEAVALFLLPLAWGPTRWRRS